jgi:hypothetical protein
MMMVVMVVMVVMMMTMRSRPDPDVNTGAMMVMVMMMVSDHDLGGPSAATLCQTLIVGFQQRQGVRDGVEKVAIARSLRKFRAAGRRRLGSGHRGEGCGRSQ